MIGDPPNDHLGITYTNHGKSREYRAFDGLTLRDVRLTPGHVRIFEVLP